MVSKQVQNLSFIVNQDGTSQKLSQFILVETNSPVSLIDRVANGTGVDGVTHVVTVTPSRQDQL